MDTIRLSSSLKDLRSFNLWQSLVAEFLGTFFLVFIGFGSAYNNMNPVKLGLGFGLAGAVIIFMFGPISGGHINPAVSFGLLVARQISLIRFVLYSIIQIIGASVAFSILLMLTNGNVLDKSVWSANVTAIPNLNHIKSVNMTEVIHRIESPTSKIICELVITFVLVFTVMRLCVEKNRSSTEKGLAPLIIGIAITIGVFCGMNISGGSMNPAASLGKYFFRKSRGVSNHIIGPLLGAGLAGLLFQLLFTSVISRKHIMSYLFSKDFEKNDGKGNESELSPHRKTDNF